MDNIINGSEANLKAFMKKKEKIFFKLKWSLIFIFFFSFFIISDFTHVYYHEQVHAAIFDSYNVEYTYGWEFRGALLAFYVASNDTRNCDAMCMGLQMENEIVSYNLAYIFYSLWIIMFIYLIKCYVKDFYQYAERINRI
jgi:hypothetical protein